MKIKEIMTKSACSISASEHLNEAACLMWELDCGVVPVTDADGKVIGVVTDRDICMAAYTSGLPLSAIPVSTAMSRTLFSVSPDDSLDKAEEVMRHHQVRRLPVVNKKNELQGVLSLNDIGLAYQHKTFGNEIKPSEVAKTLGAICEHTHGSLVKKAS